MPLLSRAGFCHCSREQESATAIASEIMPQLSRAEFRHSYRELDNATALGARICHRLTAIVKTGILPQFRFSATAIACKILPQLLRMR